MGFFRGSAISNIGLTLQDKLHDIDIQASNTNLALIGIAVVLIFRHLYLLILPKPIPGIPYNAQSARRLLGDVPAMTSHIAHTEGGTFITYIMEAMKTLNAPLIQVFIRPLSKPLLILADFPEAHDILVRRKDFDRSHTLGDLVQGLAPDHHIHLKTNAAWKAQRRLVQNLMTPSFLHNVAGPVIHQSVSRMIDLWRAKSSIANGRPWAAGDDINQMALDAVMAFAFGGKFEHSATRPALEVIGKLDAMTVKTLQRSAPDEPLVFPKGKVDEVLQSTLDLTETVGEVQGNPVPSLMWAYVTRKPKIRRAIQIKEAYINKELRDAAERFHKSPGGAIKSAADYMIEQEKELALKDGREPNYLSRVMVDEVGKFLSAI